MVSEIEFALRYTKAKIIGITRTNGKTTTTMLTYHILKKAGVDVCLAGNVGKSLALQLAERDFEYCVLELSNFQLDDMYHSRVNIAVLLNITEDHLDSYDYKMQRYIESKFRITQNQQPDDAFIYCYDDELIAAEVAKKKLPAQLFPFSIREKKEPGAYLENENINLTINNQTFIMSIHELALQGKHNIYNTMAAGIVGRLLDLRKESIRESLSDFQNVEHRLERVSKVHGIEFINDSKATNINSAWYALESINTPIIWIVGGVDKGNNYEMVMDLVRLKVKAIVCLGVDNKKIHETFKNIVEIIVDTTSASEAVKASYRLGKKGDTVLLAPACASFDLFENYEDRGRQFKKAVQQL
jgi:UDP-N-acetylmuramoylalanine--D-glutamate ligase